MPLPSLRMFSISQPLSRNLTFLLRPYTVVFDIPSFFNVIDGDLFDQALLSFIHLFSSLHFFSSSCFDSVIP